MPQGSKPYLRGFHLSFRGLGSQKLGLSHASSQVTVSASQRCIQLGLRLQNPGFNQALRTFARPWGLSQCSWAWIRSFRLKSPGFRRDCSKLGFINPASPQGFSPKITRTSPPSGPLPCLHQKFTKKKRSKQKQQGKGTDDHILPLGI